MPQYSDPSHTRYRYTEYIPYDCASGPFQVYLSKNAEVQKLRNLRNIRDVNSHLVDQEIYLLKYWKIQQVQGRFNTILA
ncbi:hypothetical protein QCA50_014493 [Cerrena zonata]|uniref:Uncharacterized protein n=1 Tax=Cerrena zonata TaxID=2478898 RepID=A0AAW0FLL4_9APHY